MSSNIGTLVIAPIRPQDSLDTYPAFFANDGLGGHYQVDTITDRDNIPTERRVAGMVCYVVATDIFYYLQGGIANVNWQIFVAGISASPVSTFISLTDAPSSYVGHADSFVQVKTNETGVDFHKFAKGSVALDLVNTVYTINNSKISVGDLPTITLHNPVPGATQYLTSVVNVVSGSFQVELSGVPTISGYKISWLII